MNQTKPTLRRSAYVVGRTLLIALAVGVAISVYQICAHLVTDAGARLTQGSWPAFLLALAIGLGLYALCVAANRRLPGYYGSGIPQIEAYHRGWYRFTAWKMLLLLFCNSLLAFFCGFLLGSEGPSVSMATSIAILIGLLFG